MTIACAVAGNPGVGKTFSANFGDATSTAVVSLVSGGRETPLLTPSVPPHSGMLVAIARDT